MLEPNKIFVGERFLCAGCASANVLHLLLPNLSSSNLRAMVVFITTLYENVLHIVYNNYLVHTQRVLDSLYLTSKWVCLIKKESYSGTAQMNAV